MSDSLKSNENKNAERIYFPELDGLRFIAFLLVFAHHHLLFINTPCLKPLQANFWIGVDLFFILSAFLFAKLLIAEYDKTQTISFKKFYTRRILRIWPLYFLFVGFCLALYPLTIGPIGNEVRMRTIGLFTFSDNIMAAIHGFNPIPYVAHLWTIAYEEQFYAFIPFVIILLVHASVKTKLISAISVFLLFNGIRLAFIAGHVDSTAIMVLPFTRFESIFLGIILGFGGFDLLLKKISPLVAGLLGICAFMLLCFLPKINVLSYWLIASYSLAGITTLLIFISVTNSKRLKKILSSRFFVFLGKRSYGLYVFHLLGNGVADYMRTHIPALPSGLFALFIYSLSFTIIAAIISYRLVETPFLKLKKRFEVIHSRPV